MRMISGSWRIVVRLITRHEIWALKVALGVPALGIYSMMSLSVWIAIPILGVSVISAAIASAVGTDSALYTLVPVLIAAVLITPWFLRWALILFGLVLFGDRRMAENRVERLEARLQKHQ